MRTCLNVLIAASALLFFFSSAPAASFESVKQSTPDTLYEWKDWVLFDQEDRLCPTNYSDGDTYRCSWPSRLRLDLTRKGGTFAQDWTVLARGWQPLVGKVQFALSTP
ncbi:MAG: hypothetical protein JJV98_10310, partial [Desulfosarcina sp.]|nr:hypothetical protein [Desulfobacterales bacterium]